MSENSENLSHILSELRTLTQLQSQQVATLIQQMEDLKTKQEEHHQRLETTSGNLQATIEAHTQQLLKQDEQMERLENAILALHKLR